MSDDFIVSGHFVCPQCGEKLSGPAGKDEPEPSDMLSCPLHGEIGRFEALNEKAGEIAARHVADQIEQLFKNTGFTVTKK